MSKPELIMTVGLPRSGKSTWARARGWPIVSPDSIRLALHGNAFIGSAEPFVWAIAKTMVSALFLSGHDRVILDATNTTVERREGWRSSDWSRKFMLVMTDQKTCEERALADYRPELLPVIARMANGFEFTSGIEFDPGEGYFV